MLTTRVSRLLALATAVALAGIGPLAQTPAAPFDVVLAGGRVVDGTGGPWFLADVGIRGDRIASLGDLHELAATTRIDARGLVVAPGFIDPHVHARERLFELPNAEGYLLQGLTTVVDGNDGSSPLPLGAYFEQAAVREFSPNLALFVGQGSVREAVMGSANRKASGAEIARMQAIGATAMTDGPGRNGACRWRHLHLAPAG
ncbi:MAG: amidohydrolase family protein [Acidobacteriota bacterium]